MSKIHIFFIKIPFLYSSTYKLIACKLIITQSLDSNSELRNMESILVKFHRNMVKTFYVMEFMR